MKRNVVFVALSTFSVQGAAYLAQFLLAGLLAPEQFAVVRTVEASLQILFTVAPMGLSLLVVRFAAKGIGDAGMHPGFSAYLVLAAGMGIAVAAAVGAVLLFFGQREADRFLLIVLPVLLLSNISRTALNYLNGRERFADVALATFVASVAYLIALTILANHLGLYGWVVAKYLVECCFVVVALTFAWRHLGPVAFGGIDVRALLGEGLSVSMSLVFRSAIDNIPLLTLAYLSMNKDEVAMYGLGTLLVASGMIIPAAVNGVLLPRYSALVANDQAALAECHRKYIRVLSAIGVASAVAIVVGGSVLSLFVVQGYQGIEWLLVWLAPVIPLRAITSLNGNLLLVRGRTSTGTMLNAGGAVLSAAMSWTAGHYFGIWGVAVVALLIEIVLVILFSTSAKRQS